MTDKPISASPTDTYTLDERAKETDNNRSAQAGHAVSGDLDVNPYQVAMIRERVALADQGAFAGRERVNAVFARWGVDVDVD
jgi:predicted transcriptional regulator